MRDTPLVDRIEGSLSDTHRDALQLLGVIALVAVVIPFVIFAVPQVVGADQSYTVLSGSMEPTLSPGDVVIVNEVPTRDIERGDVITFGGDATTPPTTHRVVDITESSGERAFATKGDNNENVDIAPTPASNVRGKVMELPFTIPVAGHSLFVIPFIGYLIRFANTTVGFVVLVGGPLLLFAGSELLTFVRAVREDGDGPNGDTPVRSDDAGGETRAEESADEQTGFTIGMNVVIVAIPFLAALAGTSGYHAYLNRTAVAAAVATGAAMLSLLLLILVLLDSGSDPSRSTQAELSTGSSSAERPDRAALSEGSTADSHDSIDDGSDLDEPSPTPRSTEPGDTTFSLSPEDGGEQRGSE